MSTQENEDLSAQAVSPEAVEHYLREHPDFFATREELLGELSLPHSCGPAVSLIERQVALLREQNRRYHSQLQELLQIARNNDNLIERLQRLTLGLMDNTELDESLALLQVSLQEDFQADAATLRLFADEGQVTLDERRFDFLDIGFVAHDELADSMKKTLANGKPLCGRLKNEQLDYLFGDDAGRITSAALLPLAVSQPFAGHTRRLGLLAIGSHKAERFNPEMGTTYLNYLSELISRKLAPHL